MKIPMRVGNAVGTIRRRARKARRRIRRKRRKKRSTLMRAEATVKVKIGLSQEKSLPVIQGKKNLSPSKETMTLLQKLPKSNKPFPSL